ncbi:MAG TPA: phosphate signaling complex protein PhoU [Candidatus Limnocylindrales bacterium]|nr:phosphate signaling complex protein PhoU [Candidatus Limnocylindrales bacterium]
MSQTHRTIHSRQALDDGLLGLQRDLRSLSSLVDVAIERSIRALARLDRPLAESVIEDDRAINELRFRIEDDAIHLIASQQPLAGDLRTVIAVLNVIVELERIGDYCVGIGKIVLLHGDMPLLKPLVDVPRMAQLVRDMLRDAIDAFIVRDEKLAEEVAARDDEVDRLYDQVYRELLTFMLNDPRTIDRATWLIWVSHNLERIGDRVQNICERTLYEVTGVMREFSRPIEDVH